MSSPLLLKPEETRQKLAGIYAPIADELAEAERIFAAELGSRWAFVQQLVGFHVALAW